MDLPGRPATLLLELDLTALPADPDPDDPLAKLRARNAHQLRPLLRALHEAADDPRVVGLVARLGGTLPWATMQELRRGVAAFGKPTVAWAESFGEESGDMTAYVLATAFDEIWLQPGGGLGMLGVATETTFLRGVLDKLGLEPQLEQRYEYKNAADRIMRTEFTEAHREAADRVAASVFDDAVETIAAGRGLTPERVRELIDTGPRIAVEAHEAGLVDQLGYRDQVYAAAREAGRRRCRTAVRRPVAPAPAARRCPGVARAISRWCACTARSAPDGPGAARWAARSAATRSPPRCGRRWPTTPRAASCCTSTPPAVRRWRRTRSGARCAGCARRASR